MIDIKLIRENPDFYKKATKAKRADSEIIDKLLNVDEKRRKLKNQVDDLRAKRNKLSQDVSFRDIAKKIKDELKTLEDQLVKMEKDTNIYIRQIPNPPLSDVKTGKDDTQNDVVRKWGEPKKFDFTPLDHLDLGEKLGIIDVERAAKVSGSRFGYLKGDGVLLEFALIQLAMKVLIQEGFVPVIPPILIKKESMAGMGYLEHGGEEDMYLLDKDGLVLVGTSEQSIGPMHMNETFDVKDLPKRYVGFSHCFRREAGSYGKDTRGILRVHQFDKVEMFSFTTIENSDKEHNFLLSLEEKLLQMLEIPYQVIKMCSGDLGIPAARKYDLEAWMPGQGKYREVTSTSTCTDFQSRRLNIKYRDKAESKYVHMLNGTAFAIGRMIIAILENNQNKDGTINIPRAVKDYIGKEILS